MSTNIRLLRKTWYLLLFLVLFAGCTGSPSAANQPIKFGYTQRWGDYTLVIGDKKGFFKDNGLDVRSLYYSSVSATLSDIASSQIDAAIMTLGDVLNVNYHNQMIAVAISDDGGVKAIVANPSIVKASDLRGKKIGVPIGSAYEILITDLLASGNLKTGDVSLVDINPENVPQAIRDGKIDAGVTWEPFTTTARGMGDRILFSSEQLPGLFSNVIVFHADYVNNHPEEVRLFLNAWFNAVDYRVKSADEANHLIAFSLNIPIDKINGDARLLGLTDNKNLYTRSPAGNAISIYKLAQINADFLVRNGSLTTVPSMLELFNPAFLDQ